MTTLEALLLITATFALIAVFMCSVWAGPVHLHRLSVRSPSANTRQCIEPELKCMKRRIDESGMGNRKRRLWIAAAGLLTPAMLVILVW